MDPVGIVLLEHLPASFSESTLKSIIAHVPCKGRVLSSCLVPDNDTITAQVQFEKQEDVEAAVRLWDQLTIDGITISASSEADTKRRLAKNVTAQHNSGLRYPFAPMNVGWLFEYVNSMRNPEKSITMCRVLECLMVNAVATSDPFLEHAVVHFYTKFTCAAWNKAQGFMPDGVAFELCRQVFEVIGLIRRYPSANVKSRKMLLTLVERVVDDITKVAITSKALAVNKAIPEIIASIRNSIATLRQHQLNAQNPPPATADGSTDGAAANNDSSPAIASQPTSGTPGPTPPETETALHQLSSWLKFLFSCLSSHHNQIPTFPETTVVAPCSEHCPCYQRLKGRFPVYLSDVEKIKIIDSLVITAARDGDDDVASIARELLQRYSIEFCTRAVAHVQNGKFAILRLYLFEAFRLAKKAQQLHNNAESSKTYDLIEISLLKAQEVCSQHDNLKSVLTLIQNGLTSIVRLRANPTVAASAVQDMYTLQFSLTQLFTSLSAQNLLLCVHVGDSTLAARGKPPRCGNPACNAQKVELLKCSGCKQVYYCSAVCQRADWKVHKLVCRGVQQPKPKSEDIAPGASDSSAAQKSNSPTTASPNTARRKVLKLTPATERLTPRVPQATAASAAANAETAADEAQ